MSRKPDRYMVRSVIITLGLTLSFLFLMIFLQVWGGDTGGDFYYPPRAQITQGPTAIDMEQEKAPSVFLRAVRSLINLKTSIRVVENTINTMAFITLSGSL